MYMRKENSWTWKIVKSTREFQAIGTHTVGGSLNRMNNQPDDHADDPEIAQCSQCLGYLLHCFVV